MKKSPLLLAVIFLVAGLSQVMAQAPNREGPPPVLFIVREEIKASKMPAHNRHSESYARIFAKLKTPNHRIALVPVAGSENEVIYITPLQTFAELEQMNRDTDKAMAAAASGGMKSELDRLDKEAPDLHAGMRDMFTVYQPTLSYQPNIDIRQMRYFAITTVRVRLGQEDQYGEYVRNLLNWGRDKIKADLHVAAFQVIAGSPNTTYMFFRPMKSLAEYDLRIGARVREALSEDQKKKADKMVGESVVFNETSVYAITPQMSYVPSDFAAGDPAFWNPKPAAAAMPKRRVDKRVKAANPQ